MNELPIGPFKQSRGVAPGAPPPHRGPASGSQAEGAGRNRSRLLSVPYPRSPAARSRDALLLLWVLIMETKRVEIPCSVLDDLCRYWGAPRCSGPLSSPALFL
ncbi:hypothetical protein J1605_020666 [Eschrichtius robustus]|uniref:Uncharacterized protein n=1 Tax=Eschrichtius robustus TaxID=9764 RepID=A0AB34HJR0_ESCRO|nr:hypothetical protein J1605_020666 [Eschrichtius robustus]